ARGRSRMRGTLPLLALVLTSTTSARAYAQFGVWVNSVSMTSDQQFAIYDRFIPGLVQNPVYQRPEATVDPTVKPSGIVHSSTVSMFIDLNGQIPLDDGGAMVRLTPSAHIGETPVALTPAQAVVTVAQWSDPDAIQFDVTAPYGIGRHQIIIDWTLETSTDGG